MNTNTPISKGSSAGAGGCFPVIADRAQEAIAVLDTNGVLHYANAAWMKMHGYVQLNEVVGKKITAFHNKEQLSGDVLPFLQEVTYRRQISGPVGHMHKNGTVVPTFTTMVALKDETGKVRAVIVYAMDTSEFEKLNEEIKGLKLEAEKRMSELTLTASRLEEGAKEREMVENLLRARGAELSSINKQLWQYMSEREQSQEQIQALRATLADKEKEAAELMSRLQQQKTEQLRQEHQWKMQYGSLTDAIENLRHEVVEMKHNEVEFLDGIDEDKEPVGAKNRIDREQLKQLSCMAKKFAQSP
jgi:PAS domain S-box-containing protein